MSKAPNAPESPPESSIATLRSRWLSPRRKRFWAIVAIGVYTLAGFFAVPPLLKSMTIDTLRDRTGREAAIERVRFNPYLLSLEVNGFALEDVDGERLAAFDRLLVNFQLSSLFRWAWTFGEFRLDGLYLLFERFAPADSRLTRLLADVEERAEPVDEPPEADGLPRLLVHELSLGEGAVHFRDHVPGDPVDLAFGPVTVSMQELSTLPDRNGRQSVKILLPNDAVVSWQGTISLGPLESEGSLSVEGSHLQQTTTYLKASLPLQSLEAGLSARSRYRVTETRNGGIDFELDGLEAALTDFATTGLAPATEFLAFDRLELSGGTMRFPENTLQFSAARLVEPVLDVWLDEAGDSNLMQLVPPDSTAGEPDEGTAWRLGTDEFTLVGGRVPFADRSVEPQAAVELQGIELNLQDVSNQEGAEFPTRLSAGFAAGGTIAFDGRIAALPALTANGTATASALPLSLAQPYVQQQANLRVDAGTLDTTFELSLRRDQTVSAAGSLSIAGLSVNDALEGQPLVDWDRFDADRFEADTGERSVSLSTLTFTGPYGRLVINPDQTTNLTGLMADEDDAAADEDESAAEESGYAIVIGGIAVDDGALDFSDLSLPLPFATEMRALGGTISTIDTASAEPATVALEGKVDEYGLARIHGDLNLLDPLRTTDITMEFRNLLMSNLSPYTVQFAGREIAEGKLDLDLNYVIDNGLMKGQNDIVMSDLVLGDKVEHPDAASLPLGLAVALLKDANGVIDIELPVAGDVNDPKFRIGGVIWQAFAGLVTKIVSAPFRLLGNLVGAESDDLGRFQFLAGRSDLAPPEMEQIGLLQEALQKRPELAIEVSGGYAPEIDVPALQYARLRDAVLSRVGEGVIEGGQPLRMLDQQLRSTLEAIFAERFPDISLETLKAEHSSPPADDPEGTPVLDDLAYAADLRDRLLAAEPIGQAELEDLANARAASIQEAFLASGEFAADRIEVTEPSEVESEGGEWVVMELSLAVE